MRSWCPPFSSLERIRGAHQAAREAQAAEGTARGDSRRSLATSFVSLAPGAAGEVPRQELLDDADGVAETGLFGQLRRDLLAACMHGLIADAPPQGRAELLGRH